MIKKFITIKGTGKFLNYNPANIPNNNWNSEFNRNNLIYGENGSGKTTLSYLFRSLKNDNALLLKKRSFDTSVDQRIDILTDDPINLRISYSNGRWSNHISNIEIFDINFISENIYTGSEIHNIHRINLLDIIFGQQGITLKKEISVLKENIQNNNRDLRTLKNRIEQTIESTFNADIYTTLQIDPDIGNKIEIKEAEINTAISHDEIQHKSALSLLDLFIPPLDYEIIENVLTKSIDSISKEFIDKFKEHCNYLNMNGEAEEWITKGYNSIKNDECPFCLRGLSESLDIFIAYKQYFNDEYIEFNTEVKTVNNQIQNYSLDSFLFNLESNLSNNTLLLDFWKKYLPSTIELTNVIQNKNDLTDSFREFKNTMIEKSLNPIESKPILSLETFKSKITDLNDRITLLNQQIEDYNNNISGLKNRNQVDLIVLKNNLKVLQATHKLSEPQMIIDCTEYIRLKNELETQNIEKEIKTEQLSTYSNTLFNTYSTSINGYLRLFAPYLRIRDLESGYVGQGTEPLIKYALEIDGNQISLSESSTQHCFKYCFSEGDKSALALAFFLAKLEIDGNINDTIIVFDDPISSFDLNRKTATITQLHTISQQAHQLFILTHNIVFAGEVWRELNQTESQSIKISFLNNSSILTKFDIKYDTLASVIKDSTLIKNYIVNGTIVEEVKMSIARAIRPAIESYYHLKFFDFISETEWLGNFIRQVREAQPTDPFYRLQPSLTELTDLNNYSKRYHHRFNGNADNEPIVEGELRTYCQRALDLIQII